MSSVMKRGLYVLTLLLLWTSWSAADPWDISGRWQTEGDGFAEKSFVRIYLSQEGNANLYTITSQDVPPGSVTSVDQWYVSGYDLDIQIRVSRLDVGVWSDHVTHTIRDAFPFPELRPTLNNPFKLPAYQMENGLTLEIALTSTTSGIVRLYGVIDLDVIGDTEFNVESAIWKTGTPKGGTDDAASIGSGSGCALSGLGLLGLLLLALSLRRPNV